MFEQLLEYNDVGLLILRVAVGSIFLYHAFPKLKNAKGMAGMVGMPASAIFLLGAVECIGAVSLIVGIYLQWGALALGTIMIGAMSMKIMKWRMPFAAMDKTGWEFDFILFAANAALFLSGGGSIGF